MWVRVRTQNGEKDYWAIKRKMLKILVVRYSNPSIPQDTDCERQDVRKGQWLMLNVLYRGEDPPVFSAA